MNDAKALIHSKAFWVAVCQALLGMFAVFSATYPALETVGALAIVKSVLDIYLRMNTTQPIGGITKA